MKRKDKKRIEIAKSIAAKMREFRARMGCSRHEMSDRFGVDTSAWYRYENGTRFPNFEVMYKLLKEHDVSMDWFLFDHGPRKTGGGEAVDALQARVVELENQLAEARRREEELTGNKKMAELVRQYESQFGALPDPSEFKPEMFQVLDLMRRDKRMFLELMLVCEKAKAGEK